ncbi:hypothetical protein L7F22_023257 [Adiantum nelumboides]|nr:hypothetical protein [Adiantum nelumboides]
MKQSTAGCLVSEKGFVDRSTTGMGARLPVPSSGDDLGFSKDQISTKGMRRLPYSPVGLKPPKDRLTRQRCWRLLRWSVCSASPACCLLAMAYWTRAMALFALLAGLVLLVPGHGEGAAVVFQIEKLVAFGQGFVIAGNTAALGNWVPAQGAFMTVTGDRNWAVTVELTAATRVEYKPVRVVYDTREVLEWLPGSNLVLDVPSKGPIYVNVTFP